MNALKVWGQRYYSFLHLPTHTHIFKIGTNREYVEKRSLIVITFSMISEKIVFPVNKFILKEN
jgi:hypothetical protein